MFEAGILSEACDDILPLIVSKKTSCVGVVVNKNKGKESAVTRPVVVSTCSKCLIRIINGVPGDA
jgi:hypothetical protein